MKEMLHRKTDEQLIKIIFFIDCLFSEHERAMAPIVRGKTINKIITIYLKICKEYNMIRFCSNKEYCRQLLQGLDYYFPKREEDSANGYVVLDSRRIIILDEMVL